MINRIAELEPDDPEEITKDTVFTPWYDMAEVTIENKVNQLSTILYEMGQELGDKGKRYKHALFLMTKIAEALNDHDGGFSAV